MIKNLNGGGVIQNLTLDASCTFKNTSTYTNPSGAFASTVNGGTIRKCASYATYTNNGSATAVGGFVGKVSGKGVTIDGCIFGGTVTNLAATANAFVGTVDSLNNGATATIKNSIARGTAETGDDVGYFENTYAVLASGSYGGNADITKTDLNEAVWIINDKREQAESGEEVKVYLNVDENGSPCFGDKNNRTIRVRIENRTADGSTEFEYYAPRKLEGTNTVQNRFAPGSVSRKVWEVSGAEHRSNYVYFGKNTDVIVTYHNTIATSDVTAMNGATFYTEYKIEQEKAELRSMVDAYEKMDSAYFGGYAFEVSKNAWIAKAKEVLAVGDFEALTQEEYDALTTDAKKTDAITQEKARIAELKALPARLQEIVEQAQNLEAYVVEMTDPEDYPSIQDYEIYKHVASIKGYKIENAADWMKAVELSNFAETPNATNFSGLTLHLTKNIDMSVYPEDYEGSKQMLPLCYSGYFDGYLDGHGYSFENINMEIDSPLGPVGLIGVLGQNIAGTVQNVGIESGSIKVTGQPRLKQALKVAGRGNIVGGIVGKNYVADCLIRKCRNNADISVENVDYVAGILGDGRTSAIIDSCINEGHTGYGGYGILGYGYRRAKTYNSMSGAVDKTAVGYHGAISGLYNPYDTETVPNEEYKNTSEYTTALEEENIEAAMKEYICNVSGIKTIVNFSSTTSGFATDQGKAEKNYNFKHSVMSSAAAGWTINANYVDTEYGDRVYYTLDENGDVRFGAADGSDQIYRIKLICDQHGETCIDHPTRYAYGIAGREITLGFDVEANYYACTDENVTIKGNVLTFSEGAEVEENTFTVYADYNADRGNVNEDSAINVLDALTAVQMVVNKKTPVLKTADVNSNHKVDIRDAYQIIRYTLNGKNENITADFIAGEPEKESDYLKVASYNLKGLYYNPAGPSGIGTYLGRQDEVLAELKAIDADIIGFQEVVYKATRSDGEDELQLLYDGLNKELGEDDKYEDMHYVPTRYFAEETADGSNSAGDGIISKYPIIDNKTIFFKGMSFPDDPTKHLDQSNNRAFTWAKIDVDENGEYVSFKDDPESEDIIFYFYHLATESDPMAAAELQYILQYMKEHHSGDRVVGVGDLNLGAYHTKAVLDKVNDSNNSYTALNGGDHHNTYARTNPYSGSMIDNIIISDNLEYFRFSENRLSGAPGLNTRAQLYVEPSTWETWAGISTKPFGTPYDGNAFTDTAWTASDHMPIWAYIKK
ncbi:MAG: endonuclease/exonuclease/phosphatase family protein [Clostridia bacterium]|nr:endonuclease/exonuclease/phosphatase family protein [Clostridia bacterium]